MKWIKHQILPLVLLSALPFTSAAQNMHNRWAVGFHFGKTEYVGDWGNAFLRLDKAFYEYTAISINRYLNNSFDAALFGGYGNFGYNTKDVHLVSGTKTDIALQLRYKLDNDYLLSSDNRLSPFLSVGFGFAHFTGEHIWNGRSLFGQAGAGVSYKINRVLSLQYQLNYSYTSDDKRDGKIGGLNDAYFTHALGIIFSFGKAQQSKRDQPINQGFSPGNSKRNKESTDCFRKNKR